MRLNRSQWIALVIAAALLLWFGSGLIGVGMEGPAVPPSAEKPKGKPLQRVRVRTLQAEEVAREVVIHGFTEPARRVTLGAESEGRVVAVGAERGSAVEEGVAVARLDLRDRRERLSGAEALVHQRELEYRAAKKLRKENLRAESQLAEALTLLEQAQAQLRTAQMELTHAVIAAPFAGRLEERMVEVGNYVKVGDPVAEVVELSPLIVTAQATEQEVRMLRRGLAGRARLVTGQSAVGTLRYVAATADPETRTFTVELELPNADGSLAAGVTAVIAVEVARGPAHYVSAALLSLNDEGVLGVKAVDEAGRVRFHHAEVVSADGGGVWLGGLPQRVRLITVGQGFVRDGQRVEAAEEGVGNTESGAAS